MGIAILNMRSLSLEHEIGDDGSASLAAMISISMTMQYS
jgi:hypothetical protein